MNYENIIRTRFQSHPVIIPNITQRRTRAFMTSSTFSTNSQTQSMMRGTTTLIKSTLSLVVRGEGGGGGALTLGRTTLLDRISTEIGFKADFF